MTVKVNTASSVCLFVSRVRFRYCLANVSVFDSDEFEQTLNGHNHQDNIFRRCSMLGNY